MEAYETLRSLSRVAIALAGFTGIVAVLGHRSSGRWGALEWLRLRLLLETSLGVLFLSLTPLLLEQIPEPEALIWPLCNGLQATVHVAGMLVLLSRVRRLEPSQWPPEERRYTSALAPVSILLVLLQGSTTLGMLAPYASFLFLLGLVYLLGLAALHFVLLLVPDPE